MASMQKFLNGYANKAKKELQGKQAKYDFDHSKEEQTNDNKYQNANKNIIRIAKDPS